MKRHLFGMLLLSILPMLSAPGAEKDPLQFFRYMRTARRSAAETGRAWYEILCDAVFYSAVDDLGADMRITRPDHPATSSSVVPFSSCPQSFAASESFPMSQLFA